MKILDRLDKGLDPQVYGDGSQAYDFIYVSDCAKANVCAMKAQATDNFYNVGTGKRTTIKTLTELILEITGAKQKIHYEPGGMTFVKNRIGCPKKAMRDLAFSASISLDEGLKQLILWRNSHVDAVAQRRVAAGLLEEV
jgi:UDP-glucose 4-epimerase